MPPHPLTFWHVAGDLIWRGDARCVPILEAQAQALRDLYEDEARAAYVARDMKAARHAANLWTELGNALDALDTWRRVVGRTIQPMQPAAVPIAMVIEVLGQRLSVPINDAA